jgi:SAM-dependent methyltransferase
MDSRHSISLLDPQPRERILDAGCGTGRNLGRLLDHGCEPFGIDFSKGMLAVAARAHPDVPLALADLHLPLPFISEQFDAVLCALIGEHLDELRGTLAEMHRLLRPRGRIVFSTYHPAMAEAGKEANFNVDGTEYRLGAVRHSVEQYESAVAGAGFQNIERFEFNGDRKLVEAVPAAAKYLDFPVLLVIRARK